MSLQLQPASPTRWHGVLPSACVEPSIGISDLSAFLREEDEKARKHREESNVLGWREPLRTASKLLREGRVAKGWDGYEADPITPAAVDEAVSFINALPDGIQIPDVTPEPTGEISFDWRDGREMILSISTSDGTLVYAFTSRFGERQHGEQRFLGEIPRAILVLLEKYFCR